MEAIGELKPRPKVARVIVSGHSGAGEGIDQMMLGGDPESPVSARLNGLVLMDAINGPGEFNGLRAFLKKKLADELAAIKALAKEDRKLAFLKTSFRFFGSYSHGPATNDYYSKWYAGPIPKADQAM